MNIPTLAIAIGVFGLTQIASVGQTTNISINPEADAFIREAAPASNYGRAGNLSVAGASATNGFGMPGGRANSLARFRFGDVVASLDATFGEQNWFVTSAALQLYELAAPNNPLFSRGVGQFEVRWLATGDKWAEGTGSPSVPTTDGVAFQDLPSLLSPTDLSLGIFTNNGTDGPLTIPLSLPSGFAEDLRSGGPTTLHFTPASDSIGFTFLSRSDPRTNLRITLDLTIAAGPPPRIASIEQTGSDEVTIRFNARSNWTHILQFRDSISTNVAGGWVNLFTAKAQPFDSPMQVCDSTTNQQRLYRLCLSP